MKLGEKVTWGKTGSASEGAFSRDSEGRGEGSIKQPISYVCAESSLTSAHPEDSKWTESHWWESGKKKIRDNHYWWHPVIKKKKKFVQGYRQRKNLKVA